MDINEFIQQKYLKVADQASTENDLGDKENLIIDEIKKGNNLAFNLLLKCYHRAIIAHMFKSGINEKNENFDEYYNRYVEVLWRCAMKYDTSAISDGREKAKFLTFVYAGFRNAFRNIYKKQKVQEKQLRNLFYMDAPLKDIDGVDRQKITMYDLTSMSAYKRETQNIEYREIIEKLSELFPKSELDIVKLKSGYENGGEYLLEDIAKMPEYNCSRQRISQRYFKVLEEIKDIQTIGYRVKCLLEENKTDEEVLFEELSQRTNLKAEWLKYYYEAYEFLFGTGEKPERPSNLRKAKHQGKEIYEL